MYELFDIYSNETHEFFSEKELVDFANFKLVRGREKDGFEPVEELIKDELEALNFLDSIDIIMDSRLNFDEFLGYLRMIESKLSKENREGFRLLLNDVEKNGLKD